MAALESKALIIWGMGARLTYCLIGVKITSAEHHCCAEPDHNGEQQDGAPDYARGRQPGVHHARARQRAARRGAHHSLLQPNHICLLVDPVLL